LGQHSAYMVSVHLKLKYLKSSKFIWIEYISTWSIERVNVQDVCEKFFIYVLLILCKFASISSSVNFSVWSIEESELGTSECHISRYRSKCQANEYKTNYIDAWRGINFFPSCLKEVSWIYSILSWSSQIFLCFFIDYSWLLIFIYICMHQSRCNGLEGGVEALSNILKVHSFSKSSRKQN